MPCLHLIALTDDAERLRGALVLALSGRALGQRARMFLQLDAVRLLNPDMPSAPRDADHIAVGLPTLARLIDEALGDGVEIIACQSGLALARLAADTLDPRIETAGPLAFLADVSEDDRLLLV